MPDPTRIKLALAAIESTYGTDATPSTGGDEVEVMENFWTNITPDQLNDNLLEGVGTGFGEPGGQSPESTGQFVSFSLAVPLKGLDTAFSSSNVPEADVLLRACGLEQTVDTTAGAELVNYTPRDTGFESATIYLYSGNKEFQVVGCFGTATLTFNAGEIAQASFEFQGLLNAVNEAGLPSGISFPASGVPKLTVKSAGFTVNGFDPSAFTQVTFNTNTDIAERPGGNASDAHAGYWPSDLRTTMSAAYEVPAISSHDPVTLRANGTEFSGDLGTLGTTQYNQLDVTWPAARYTSVDPSENDGLAHYDVEAVLRHTDATTQDSIDIQWS